MEAYHGRYVGRVVSNPADKPYGYIGIVSVRKEDGSEANLPTQADLFIHNDDCKSPLRVGMELVFDVREDERRGEGFYRAEYAEETTNSRLDGIAKGGIELALQGYNGGRYIDHTSVFATWCISAALAAKVKEMTMEDKTVRLLLVQGRDRHSGGGFWATEHRQLVDLAAPMVHLSFNQPGIHRLFALIVWADKPGDLADLYLARNDDVYKTSVISSEGTNIILEEKVGERPDWSHGKEWNIHHFGSGYIQAELPETLFAAPPRDWDWVNWMFKEKPRDQCAFRRRRIVAYSFQPFVAMPIYYGALSVLWLTRLLVVGVLLSMGRRGIDYDSIRRFRYPIKWIWTDLGESVFTLTIGKAKTSFLYPVSPAMLLVIALMTFMWAVVTGISFWSFVWLKPLAYIVLFWAALFSAHSLIEMWFARIDKEAREAARKEREREEKRRMLEEEVNRVICSASGPKKPDVWQLPIGPRTVRFYAIAVKQMVCKNFVTT